MRQGPLYPLNALMLHGLIYARHAHGLGTDPANDFTAEVRAYFGTGTQLQEMYVTPSLLTPENWDALAEAAQWSRRSAEALGDTHWVGGDPWRLEPYGWAAWSPAKATLVLRNPKDSPQSIAVGRGGGVRAAAGRAATLPGAQALASGSRQAAHRARRGRPAPLPSGAVRGADAGRGAVGRSLRSSLVP